MRSLDRGQSVVVRQKDPLPVIGYKPEDKYLKLYIRTNICDSNGLASADRLIERKVNR